MPDPADLLRRLPGLMADDGPTPDEMKRWGRRRGRRRRAGLAALGVLLLVAGSSVALSQRQRDDTVNAGPSPSAPSVPTSDRPTTPDPPGAELTLSPSGPVQPGARAALVVTDPPPDGTEVFVAQCAREVLEVDPRTVIDWCGEPTLQAAPDLSVVVARVLRTNRLGRIDCASEPGRCVVGVRVDVSGSSDDAFAALTFVDDLPPVTNPTVDAPPPVDGYVDGEVAAVAVRGLQPREGVTVSQCPTELQSGGTGCEGMASPTVVTAGPDGVAHVGIRLYHDVFVGYRGPGYVVCSPCELQVEPAGSEPPPPFRIVMAPTASPSRPQVRVEPAGPHSPGETVTIAGTGFRPRRGSERADDGVRVGWCAAEPHPAGAASCKHPVGPGQQIPVAGDGSFRISGFRLPGPADEVIDVRCSERPGACVLGWQPEEGSDYAFAVPLDLTG